MKQTKTNQFDIILLQAFESVLETRNAMHSYSNAAYVQSETPT